MKKAIRDSQEEMVSLQVDLLVIKEILAWMVHLVLMALKEIRERREKSVMLAQCRLEDLKEIMAVLGNQGSQEPQDPGELLDYKGAKEKRVLQGQMVDLELWDNKVTLVKWAKMAPKVKRGRSSG